jgi:hypothetical protein
LTLSPSWIRYSNSCIVSLINIRWYHQCYRIFIEVYTAVSDFYLLLICNWILSSQCTSSTNTILITEDTFSIFLLLPYWLKILHLALLHALRFTEYSLYVPRFVKPLESCRRCKNHSCYDRGRMIWILRLGGENTLFW